MNGRLDHPVTASYVAGNFRILKKGSCGSEAVLSAVRDTETLLLVRLAEAGQVGSTLVKPNEAQEIRF